MFSNVIYKDLGEVIAQVDRSTSELFINPRVWSNLSTEHKDYVLLHEKGHLVLQTADEYAANQYAVEHFLAGELSEDEYNRRIVVLSELFNDTESTFPKSENTSNFDPVTAVYTLFTMATKVADKAIAESNAKNQTERQIQLAEIETNLQSSKNAKYIILSIIGILVIASIFVAIKILRK